MDIVIAVIVGIVIGIVIAALSVRMHLSGNLRIDHSIPEDDPYMFLELTKDVNTVLHKKFVVLKVRAEDFIPHK